MISVQHATKDDRIYFKQASSLSNAGYQVHIVSVTENGLPTDMSGNSFHTEDKEEIDFITLKEPDSLLTRLLKKVYLGPFYKRIIDAAARIQADLYVAHEPQSLIIARKAAEATGAQYLYDAHESLYFDNWKDKWALRKEMRRLSAFTCANSITKSALMKLNPHAIGEVIYNASILDRISAPNPKELLIVHEGSFPFNRGLELLMESLALLKEESPLFNLRIVGSLGEAEQNYFLHMIRAHQLEEHIELTGWVSYEDLEIHLHDGAIGLILNTPTPNNLYGGPANKLFNYIARSMMVIAVDLPETSQILQRYKCGVILKDRSPQTLAKVLEKALSHETWRMAFRIASSRASIALSWEKESEKLIQFYDRILK